MSKIVLHLCGGCGISVASKTLHNLSHLGSGFAEMEFNYLDSSTANIGKIEPKGEFFTIESTSHTSNKIAGSGGERGTHAVDISVAVNKYLDGKKFKEMRNGEYHVIVCSASGGTGNVIGLFLAKALVSRGIPVVTVLIGDSSTLLYAQSTLRTLASFDGLAREKNKAISIMYINNHTLGKTSNESEKLVNDLVYKAIAGLSLFLSGQNESIDEQDMLMVIDQSRYTSISVPAGLYALLIGTGTITPPPGSFPTTGRSLGRADDVCDLDIPFMAFKRGIVTDPNAASVYDKSFPIHLVNFGNFLTDENEKLNRAITSFKEITSNYKHNNFVADEGAKVNSELGIVI